MRKWELKPETKKLAANITSNFKQFQNELESEFQKQLRTELQTANELQRKDSNFHFFLSIYAFNLNQITEWEKQVELNDKIMKKRTKVLSRLNLDENSSLFSRIGGARGWRADRDSSL